MNSIFDDLLEIADETLDDVNAEAFILHPQSKAANGRAVPDPDRAVVHGRGIFDLQAGEAGGIQIGNRDFSRRRNDMRSMVNGRTPVLSIHKSELAGVKPRQGDRVDLVDRSPTLQCNVISAQPDGHGRVVLELLGG